jgi:hypothetical protein
MMANQFATGINTLLEELVKAGERSAAPNVVGSACDPNTLHDEECEGCT